MADYIKRQDVIDPFLVGKNTFAGFCTIEQAIENIESVEAADVVEVVRCRDCLFWDKHNKGIGNACSCIIHSDAVFHFYSKPSDFCNYGKAKMDGKGEGE